MPSHRPPTLVVAAVVMALEGVTTLVLGGYVGVETIVGRPADVMSSLFVAAFGLLVGAALLWVGRGMVRTERWARSPGVLTQIFALVVGVTLIQSGRLVLGASLIVAAVAGLAALLAPPTTRALYGDQD